MVHRCADTPYNFPGWERCDRIVSHGPDFAPWPFWRYLWMEDICGW